jgi:murein hydrolase activator
MMRALRLPPPCLRLLSTAVLAVFFLTNPAAPLHAQDSGEIKRELENKRQTAAERKKNLEQLARKERGLSKKLADMERAAEALAVRIDDQEKTIKEIEREERKLSKEYAALDKDRRKAAERLTRILRALWPAHLQNMENKTEGLGSWEEADRRFVWLSSIYADVVSAYEEYKDKSGALAANMAAQEAARNRLTAQYRKVNVDKDQLLAKRLEHMREIRNLRRQRLNQEEELKEILGVIGKLNYRLDSMADGDLAAMKGRLPWPAKGRLAAAFAPDASPAVRGMGLAVAPGTKVAAVHAGKVAHAEKLRGMGTVVIVYHGDNYYTVYAYLSDANVKAGDNVARGQPLGTAGYYPAASGPGLYFELRFREKAINPGEWLAKQS